jgi:hypothetical protein
MKKESVEFESFHNKTKIQIQVMAEDLAAHVAEKINAQPFSKTQTDDVMYPKQLLLELLIKELEARV